MSKYENASFIKENNCFADVKLPNPVIVFTEDCDMKHKLRRTFSNRKTKQLLGNFGSATDLYQCWAKKSWGRQPIIWPFLFKNCMKLKNFWAKRGRKGRAPLWIHQHKSSILISLDTCCVTPMSDHVSNSSNLPWNFLVEVHLNA